MKIIYTFALFSVTITLAAFIVSCADSKKPNGDDEQTNVDGEQTNGDGEQTNGNGEQTNGDGEQTNGNGEQTNGDGEQTNGNGEQTNGDGEQTNGDGEQTNGDGELSANYALVVDTFNSDDRFTFANNTINNIEGTEVGMEKHPNTKIVLQIKDNTKPSNENAVYAIIPANHAEIDATAMFNEVVTSGNDYISQFAARVTNVGTNFEKDIPGDEFIEARTTNVDLRIGFDCEAPTNTPVGFTVDALQITCQSFGGTLRDGTGYYYPDGVTAINVFSLEEVQTSLKNAVEKQSIAFQLARFANQTEYQSASNAFKEGWDLVIQEGDSAAAIDYVNGLAAFYAEEGAEVETKTFDTTVTLAFLESGDEPEMLFNPAEYGGTISVHRKIVASELSEDELVEIASGWNAQSGTKTYTYYSAFGNNHLSDEELPSLVPVQKINKNGILIDISKMQADFSTENSTDQTKVETKVYVFTTDEFAHKVFLKLQSLPNTFAQLPNFADSTEDGYYFAVVPVRPAWGSPKISGKYNIYIVITNYIAAGVTDDALEISFESLQRDLETALKGYTGVSNLEIPAEPGQPRQFQPIPDPTHGETWSATSILVSIRD